MTQALLFEVESRRTKGTDLSAPQGYRGLAAFHKYWGKKPVEYCTYLIENLTHEKDVVLDPFIGCGLVAREALQRKRRFIGIDINPIAIELSNFFVNLPNQNELAKVLQKMEREVRPEIEKTYERLNAHVATHFLWDGDNLNSIWAFNGRQRYEWRPTIHDLELSRKYSGYSAKYARNLNFFTNSRINTSPQMTIRDLFTGRALHNIDIILQFIKRQPDNIKTSLLLTLTAALGQMSNMVFAVGKRGKTTGKIQERVSVGSWVIGYWRPKVHFEINVWNCFQNRARKLIRALNEIDPDNHTTITNNCIDVIESRAQVALIKDDARHVLPKIPPNSLSLILTDPPHSDRIPYLELSELWNAFLEEEAMFDHEIVVSNALERNKDRVTYTKEMEEFFVGAVRALRNGGTMAILFNARDSESWSYLRSLQRRTNLIEFRGCFPMLYSARSVIQDNRKGALKYDYVLIYQKRSNSRTVHSRWKILTKLDGWSRTLPARDN